MAGSQVLTYRAGILGASSTGKSTLLWLLALALPCAWLWDPQWGHRCPPGGRLYRPRAADRDSSRGGRYFEDIDAIALEAADTGGLTLVIDEARGAVRIGGVAPESVNTIASEGRHLPKPPKPQTGVGLVVCSQMPKQLPTDWWSQLEHFFVFRLSNPTQLRWARDMGFDAAKVAQLGTGQFFHLDLRQPGPPHFHQHALDGACATSTQQQLNNAAAAA